MKGLAKGWKHLAPQQQALRPHLLAPLKAILLPPPLPHLEIVLAAPALLIILA